MSSIVNKIKDAVHHDKSSSHSQPEGTSGPHNSRAANAADPRVDSDRDHRGAPGSAIGGNNVTHGVGATAGFTSGGPAPNTAGPHTSDMMNKADPRVDSDRDGRAGLPGTHGPTGVSGVPGTHGTHGTTGTSGLTGSHGTYGTTGASGLTGTHDTHGNSGLPGTHGTHGISGLTGATHNTSSNAGPHNSNLMNKADPRVDSDRDGRAAPGTFGGSSGLTGTHGTHGTSGLTGTHGTHGLTSGPGPAPNTAGPHTSDMLNKVDPRVDSDRDGSKTFGGNQTYSSTRTAGGMVKDPTDAAQVPPSVLRKHIGEPAIHHDDVTHDRERRNSSVTHQEAYRGI